MKTLTIATAALALAVVPVAADESRIATKLRALAEAQERDPVRVSEEATSRCSVNNVGAAANLLEANPTPEVFQTLQNGDFTAAAMVDADDPRNHVADTDWVAASWSSPSGILWGRDYAPDAVFEGVTRLLDNRQARINAYTLSFASLTPRLVIHGLIHQGTEDLWLMLSVNGVIVGIPATDQGDRIGWPLCASGLFFIDDAFDARGFIPNKYLRL